MKKPILIIGLQIIAILLLLITRSAVSNRISTSGMVLEKIDDKISYYKTENANLSEKLFSVSSLNNIASEAALLGFVDQKTDLHLTGSIPLAARQ